MGNFLKEFKDFAIKGNAMDMAVGVIIGGAFGNIVNSIVNDIIMPPIGWLIGGVDFTNLKITLPKVETIPGVELVPASINYGNFIQVIINFLIVAFCVFMLLKGIKKAEELEEKVLDEAPSEEEAPAAPEPTAEEKLLTEIRDLLAKK